MINLSTQHSLTSHQLTLLRKGLSFVPTMTAATTARQDMSLSLRAYHRRLKLRAHFGKNQPQQTKKTFTHPSEWEPAHSSLPPSLQEMFKKDMVDLSHLKYTPESPNLSPEEQEALGDLIRARGLVIKPADKGSAVVLMDQSDYVSEALRQLNDKEYYITLPEPMYPQTAEIIKEELTELWNNKNINKKQYTYLIGDSPPRARYFYLLPKIHKPTQKWTVPDRIPPGRPIVSDCGSESYGVAEYLDHFLTPLSILHNSYVKNTQDFISRVTALHITEPCFLFTMDVSSLYTNIEIPLGIQAVKNILTRYPDPRRPDDALIRLLDISLRRNDFVFQDKHYLQIKGTAMGKRFAPAYANIYMAEWEEGVFQKCTLLPIAYMRYLDDIWGIWTHPREDFDIFVQTLNSHHTSIKLEPELHETQVNFLDTTTFKGPEFNTTGKLDVKLYFKPTDTHSLLHKKSFHPKHVFTGILKSQLLRFSRICTRPQDSLTARKILFKALRRRGYSRSFLRSSLKTITQTTQNTPDDRQGIPLVVQYSSFGRQAVRTLRSNFEKLLGDTALGRDCRVLPAYRKSPNLQQLLVRAKLQPATQPTKRIDRFKTVRNPNTGYAYALPQNLSKKQNNCIYIIKCKKCNKLYVGETRNALNARLNQHKYVIRTREGTTSHLAMHFQEHGTNNLTMKPLEHNPNWTTTDRRKREAHWIRTLNTLHPNGLNDRKPCRTK